MQSPRCQQRNTAQEKPAPLLLVWLLAILRPVAAFSSSDPRWINLPGVAAYLVGHARPRSADRAPPLLRNVHLKTKARRRLGPSERE